jgi:hypothetical protein
MVFVTLDTDAPLDRLMTMQIVAQRPVPGRPDVRVILRGGGGASAVTTPATFSVIPATGASLDEPARLVVDARLEGTGTQPPIAFRRTMRFRFTSSTTTYLPLFLSTGCGAPSLGCTTVAAGACTVSVRCEEQGLTCGDDARCVPIDVTPSPTQADGGTTVMDAGIDVAPRPDASSRDADVAMDAAIDAATDAGCECAPRANATGTCAGASCVYRCVAGFADCDNIAANGCEAPLGTPQNCSACGMSCTGATPVCEASMRCVSGCGAMSNCGGACVDLQTSAMHCGMCGRACTGGQSCVAGVCRCAAGQTLCSGACVDVQASPVHCGMCGRACAARQSCVAGACQCPTGQTLCSGACVDVQTSAAHCGMCGRSCATGGCNGGTCAPSNDRCGGATMVTEVATDYTSSTCGAGRDVTNCVAVPEVFFAVRLATFATRVSVNAITGGPYSLAIVGTSCTSTAVSCASSTYSGAFAPGLTQYVAVQGPGAGGCGAFSLRVE